MDGSPAQPILIEARGVGVTLGGRAVLDRVDIAVHAGEVVTVVGPNGAGKSTLAKVLLGLIRPDSGSVERRSGLVIGYVPQVIPVDPVLPLTVRRLLTLTGPADGGALRAALDEVGVPAMMDAAVHELSGGELQRVMLARALMRRPDLLVLDEPTKAVDFKGEAELCRLVAETRRRRGIGVLMISHDLHVVMAATDRVVCLNHHVCCSGAPEAVNRHPEYVALFGPEAGRVLAVYRHDPTHDHGHDHAHDHGHDHVPGAGPAA